MGKKVYGVIRTGGSDKTIVFESDSFDMPHLPVGLMSKREAKQLAKECNESFGTEGFIYTVFKMKFKETI